MSALTTQKIVEADNRIVIIKFDAIPAHGHMVSKFVMFKVADTR